jgi:menaquinone-9 beta-reductase
LPLRLDVTPGLHFFFERRLVTQGYAWIFPCGERTRIGVGSAATHPRQRERLVWFLAELGLESGPTYGGVTPVVRREQVADDVFVVGDAAGQYLPVTAEGLGIVVMHGLACGRLIAAALSGDCSPGKARQHYREYVQRTDRFHRRHLTMQAVVERKSEW